LLSRAKEILNQFTSEIEVVQIDKISGKAHILLVKGGETGRQKEISTHMLIGAEGTLRIYRFNISYVILNSQ
jgi:hypothetical protein